VTSILVSYSSTVYKTHVSLKYDKEKGYFTRPPLYIFLSLLAQFFLEREMFQTKFVMKIKTHILCSITFFPGNRAVYEIMWENIAQPDS